jgi:hypothetical protein
MMNKRTIIAKVLWSACLCFVQSVFVIALFTATLIAMLLLLGFSRSDTLWTCGFGLAGMAMGFGPILTFWTWRRWPQYPLDAVGLFLVPLAAPFLVARLARFAFASMFGIHLTRSADAALIVGGVGCLAFTSVRFARAFFLYAEWPSPPRALFQR